MVCPFCEAENVERAETCEACGRPMRPEAIKPGSVVARRFEVLESLGRGGMGAVFRAHDRLLDEIVALKVIRSDVGETPEFALRFRREIKLAWKVHHRNVCAIHEYGEEERLRYISMEFVDGVDLKRLLRENGPLPPREGFDVAIQVAAGLEAIHEAGVIHRDLKTMNIMRDRKGVVRLMDFGIAKSVEAEGPGATQVGQILGTPDYMSPEQILGQKIDYRSDIYAFGVVVFELFTGRVLFGGETPVATLMKHVYQPPPLEEHAAQLPSPLVPVLRRALAKNPDNRYQTVGEMLVALKEARLAKFPQQATVTPAAPRGVEPAPQETQEPGHTAAPPATTSASTAAPVDETVCLGAQPQPTASSAVEEAFDVEFEPPPGPESFDEEFQEAARDPDFEEEFDGGRRPVADPSTVAPANKKPFR